MKSSIRKFLLGYLLLAITLSYILTALGNYFLDKTDIQQHLDAQMVISALSYQALLGDDLRQRTLKTIQNDLNHIPENISNYYHPLISSFTSDDYLNKFNFQVWDEKKKLLLYSAKAPNLNLFKGVDGFSDKIIDNQKWRVFSTGNSDTKIRTIIAEKYDTRFELAHKIAEDYLYIMLLIAPLSGFLIWIIIGKGLKILDKVAKEVANRESTHLKPVDLDKIPEELKPFIDELNKLFYRLKEGFEREKRFAADAAHELRTPIAALKAQAQVALNTNNIDEKNLALQKLIASVNRSTHTIQQLLTMSRLVSVETSANGFEQVDLVKLTVNILSTLTSAALEKQISIEFDQIPKSSNLIANPSALTILIRNLLDNAIRYCDDGGKIIIRIYQNHDYLLLEIQDNGPGISPELLSRVFERFFRVVGNKSMGSGLGLAIAKQICELHNAKIELVLSPDGPGMIARVAFPINQGF